MNLRLNLIFIFIFVIMVTLLSRVYFLSIKSNTYYEELSKQNYISRINKVPVRGIIEDRHGRKLALNQMGFSISIKPHLRSRKKAEELNEAIDLIVEHFPNLEKKKLIKKYKRKDSPYNHNHVKVVEYIPYEDFFPKYTLFSSKKNIKIDSSVKRYYPYHGVGSHIIGYVGKASKKDIEIGRASCRERVYAPV